MSLASALLKYYFIHRTAKIPWSEVAISQTPKPHSRPYWDPPTDWHGDGFDGLEFNVSHQAGLVILAGCHTPHRPDMSLAISKDDISVTPDPTKQQQQQIRIGIDVACTKEPRRTPDLSTQKKLEEWVDTFEEMFSLRERRDMKERPVPMATGFGSGDEASQVLEQKARRFYMYWALKEAYIKMVGEGLLAGWLRQLEFVNVMPPEPGEKLTAYESGLRTMFDGRDISKSVEVEVEGFDSNFLFATITRGIKEQESDIAQWGQIDIERHVRPCAEGRCSCLE